MKKATMTAALAAGLAGCLAPDEAVLSAAQEAVSPEASGRQLMVEPLVRVTPASPGVAGEGVVPSEGVATDLPVPATEGVLNALALVPALQSDALSPAGRPIAAVALATPSPVSEKFAGGVRSLAEPNAPMRH